MWESKVDLAGVARDVSRAMYGRVSVAEADDEVQAQVIREWLSGRGLPADPTDARRELRRRVVQRVYSDLRGDRRGKLAAHRRDLREMASIRPTFDADGNSASLDLLESVRAVDRSQARCESAVDARTMVEASLEVRGNDRQGRTWTDRAPAIVALLAGELTHAEAAVELGVARSAVGPLCARMLEHLRRFASRDLT